MEEGSRFPWQTQVLEGVTLSVDCTGGSDRRQGLGRPQTPSATLGRSQCGSRSQWSGRGRASSPGLALAANSSRLLPGTLSAHPAPAPLVPKLPGAPRTLGASSWPSSGGRGLRNFGKAVVGPRLQGLARGGCWAPRSFPETHGRLQSPLPGLRSGTFGLRISEVTSLWHRAAAGMGWRGGGPPCGGGLGLLSPGKEPRPACVTALETGGGSVLHSRRVSGRRCFPGRVLPRAQSKGPVCVRDADSVQTGTFSRRPEGLLLLQFGCFRKKRSDLLKSPFGSIFSFAESFCRLNNTKRSVDSDTPLSQTSLDLENCGKGGSRHHLP